MVNFNITELLYWEVNPSPRLYCRTLLENASASTCLWGPWGAIAPAEVPDQTTLFTSSIFQIVDQALPGPINGSVWADPEVTNRAGFSKAIGAKSTLSNIAQCCPTMAAAGSPGGPNITTTMDFYPPLATGLNFSLGIWDSDMPDYSYPIHD